tara:strand:- start:1725 stop:2444 length:720 start_codon:yes stop_codon:yes gene_type:complete
MTKRLYYNPASATGDPRTGHGYGKAQKIPSMGTGVGSERMVSSSETGIYTEPFIDDEDEEDIFDDKEETDRFVQMINKNVVSPDPAFWPRADRGSLGQTSVGWALGFGGTGIGEAAYRRATGQSLPVPKGQKLPMASKGIAPFPNSILYPSGFDGPPFGTGNAGQAFRTTGPARKTGTQYGASRAPLETLDDEEIPIMSFKDILDIDPDERSILRQRIRIMKLLNRIDEIDSDVNLDSA